MTAPNAAARRLPDVEIEISLDGISSSAGLPREPDTEQKVRRPPFVHRDIASSRSPVVRGPNAAITMNTVNIAPATNVNTPIVP